MTATGSPPFGTFACDSGSLEQLLGGTTLSCPCCNGRLTSEKLARLFDEVQRLAQRRVLVNANQGAQQSTSAGHYAGMIIDPHTHMDLFLVLYPHGNPVVNFGVTTVVIADCGASVAPVPDGNEPVQVLVNYLRRVLDDYIDDRLWQWKTFPEYLGYLKGKVGINAAAFVPHSGLRMTTF